MEKDHPVISSGGVSSAELLSNSAAGWYGGKMYGKGVMHAGMKERLAGGILPKGEGLRVLDVGCGVGRFLGYLGELGHRGTGVEISVASLGEARGRGYEVLEGNAEELGGLGLEAGSFDVVVFLDVLEHLFNPAATLKGAKGLLVKGGVYVVCVPNIGSVLGRWSLLCGRWPLEDAGLFDRGHLRWFTRENLDEHFGGVAVVEEGSLRSIPLEPCRRWGLWRLEKMQEEILGYLAKRWPSLWAHEFIFRLRPVEGVGEGVVEK